MRLSGVFSLFSITLCIVSARADGPAVLDVPWYCAQTQASQVPVQGLIKIPVNPGANTVDLSEVNKMIQIAESEKSWDYFSCFADSLNIQCPSDATADQRRFCLYLKGEVENLIAEYGKKTYAAGLPSPARPGLSSGLSFNPEMLSKYRTSKDFKFVSDQNALDKDVLTQGLPAFIKTRRNEPPSKLEQLYKDLTSNYEWVLNNSLLSPDQCRVNPVACEQRKADTAQAFNLLMRQPELARYLQPSPKNMGNPCVATADNIGSVIDLTNQVSQAGACAFMKTGEAVDENRITESGIPAHYRIERKSDKDGKPFYHLTFPLQFRSPNGKPNAELQKRFENKANNCFKEEAPLFRGPSREYLELEIVDAIDGHPSNSVKIKNGQDRDDSKDWDPSIDCTVITHETLHLAGLVDEYRETSIGMLTDPKTGTSQWVNDSADHVGYDCRTIGPDDSIMSHQKEAFDHARGKIDITACRYSDDNPASKNFDYKFEGLSNLVYDPNTPKDKAELARAELEKMNEASNKFDSEQRKKWKATLQSLSTAENITQCPPGFTEYTETVDDIKENETKVKQVGKLDQKNEMILLKYQKIPPVNSSILYPAQFRVLISPGCKKENALYYACSQNAYGTSQSVDFENKYSRACVNAVPDACLKGGEAWLH